MYRTFGIESIERLKKDRAMIEVYAYFKDVET